MFPIRNLSATGWGHIVDPLIRPWLSCATKSKPILRGGSRKAFQRPATHRTSARAARESCGSAAILHRMKVLIRALDRDHAPRCAGCSHDRAPFVTRFQLALALDRRHPESTACTRRRRVAALRRPYLVLAPRQWMNGAQPTDMFMRVKNASTAERNGHTASVVLSRPAGGDVSRHRSGASRQTWLSNGRGTATPSPSPAIAINRGSPSPWTYAGPSFRTICRGSFSPFLRLDDARNHIKAHRPSAAPRPRHRPLARRHINARRQPMGGLRAAVAGAGVGRT